MEIKKISSFKGKTYKKMEILTEKIIKNGNLKETKN